MAHFLLVWSVPKSEQLRAYSKDPSGLIGPLDGLEFLPSMGHTYEIFDPHRFPTNPFAHQSRWFTGLDPIRALKMCWAASRFDAILCIGDSSATLFLMLRKFLGLRKTSVLIIDPALDINYPLREFIQRITLTRADTVIVYGTNQCKVIQERLGVAVKTKFVPHRVDMNFYKRRFEQPSHTCSKFSVISVGDDKARDFDTLLNATRNLNMDVTIKSKWVNAQVALNHQATVISKRIPYLDLRNLYYQADVSVVSTYPSIHANGVTALLESFALGVPVIVSQSDALADYVKHEETALVVESQNPLALQEALLRLQSDVHLRESLANNAYSWVKQNCEVSKYVHNIIMELKTIHPNV